MRKLLIILSFLFALVSQVKTYGQLRQDITVYREDAKTVSFTVTGNHSARNLIFAVKNSYTATGSILILKQSTSSTITATYTSGTNRTVIAVYLYPSDTRDLAAATYYYDLESASTTDTNDVVTLVRGNFVLTSDIYNRLSGTDLPGSSGRYIPILETSIADGEYAKYVDGEFVGDSLNNFYSKSAVDLLLAAKIAFSDTTLKIPTKYYLSQNYRTAIAQDVLNGAKLDTTLATALLRGNWNTAYSLSHSHSNKPKLDSITVSAFLLNGITASFTSALKSNYDAAYSHTSNTSNPHSVTAVQVGLGNVTNESKATMFTSPTFTGNSSFKGYIFNGANLTPDSSNPVIATSSAEWSVVMDGDTADMWYTLNDNIAHARATNETLSNWVVVDSNVIADHVYSYVVKYNSTYYMMANRFLGASKDSNLYMWSSTDKHTWTALNSGNPVLTHSSTPTSQYWQIFNPCFVIVRDTVHLLIDGLSNTSEFSQVYSYAPLSNLNFNTNISSVASLTYAGCASLLYVPDREALIVFYADYINGGAHTTIRAKTAMLSSDLSDADSWTLAPGFGLQDTTYALADCFAFFTENVNKPKFIMLAGNNIPPYVIQTLGQYYGDFTINELYDYITNPLANIPKILFGGEVQAQKLSIGHYRLSSIEADDSNLLIKMNESTVFKIDSTKASRFYYNVRIDGDLALPSLTSSYVPFWNGSKITSTDLYYNAINYGFGTTGYSSDNKVSINKLTTATNTIINSLAIGHQTSGTPGTGLGVGMVFVTDNIYSATSELASIAATQTDMGNISADLILSTRLNNSLAEKMRLSSDGKLTVSGSIKATLPTSSSGLSSGDFWNDGGTVKIVP